MAKSFSLFLARRYLRPRSTFVLIISAISMLGVALGVLALIVVLSGMRGFELLQKDLMLGIQPHLLITCQAPKPVDAEPDYHEVLAKVRVVPGITGASPYVEGKAAFSKKDGEESHQLAAPLVRGLEEDDPLLLEITRPRRFRDKDDGLLLAGELGLRKILPEEGAEANDADQVIISRPLADDYHLGVGSEFQLGSLLQVEDFLESLNEKRAENPLLKDLEQQVRMPYHCVVAAVVEMPLAERHVIFAPLYIAQEFHELDGDVHGIGAFVTDPYDVQSAKAAVAAVLPKEWKVSSWLDENALKLRAIRTERALTSTLLFFIIIVAAFCIMNTVIVTTVQKRREIGAMKAVGARDGQIIGVFLAQSSLVGLIGTILGVALGLLTVWKIDLLREALALLGRDPFPRNVYDLQKVPMDLRAGDVARIAVASLATCVLAALLPSWAAARQDAAKALRND